MKGKRPWGWYDVIDTGSTYKVKSILVEPGKSLSLQRHMLVQSIGLLLKGQHSLKLVVKKNM